MKHAVDEIILQENAKLNLKDTTHEKIHDEVDEYDQYEIYRMSLDEKERRQCAFESKLNIYMR